MAGDELTLSVQATGINLAYQWQYQAANGQWTDLQWAKGSEYTMDPVGINRAAPTEWCSLITYGSVISDTAQITVNQPSQPRILKAPKSQVVATGASTQFKVEAAGTGFPHLSMVSQRQCHCRSY